MTIFTILRVLYEHSNIEVFIALTFIILFYFLIGHFKVEEMENASKETKFNQ